MHLKQALRFLIKTLLGALAGIQAIRIKPLGLSVRVRAAGVGDAAYHIAIPHAISGNIPLPLKLQGVADPLTERGSGFALDGVGGALYYRGLLSLSMGHAVITELAFRIEDLRNGVAFLDTSVGAIRLRDEANESSPWCVISRFVAAGDGVLAAVDENTGVADAGAVEALVGSPIQTLFSGPTGKPVIRS